MPSLAFDDIVHAAEQNQICNVIDSQLVKDSRLVSGDRFITNMKHV
jgi:hypothetical protein